MGKAAAKSDPTLQPGQFFSSLTRRSQDELFVLSELSQAPRSATPSHSHELSYISLLLEGAYLEEGDMADVTLSPFTAVFNPAGIHHTSLTGAAGARLFTIELSVSLLEQGDGIRLPRRPVSGQGVNGLLWNSVKIYLEFSQPNADLLSIESLTWEMVARLADHRESIQPPSAWFSRVKDMLHGNFRAAIRMKDLAREAGVHPVHLAKTFRNQCGQTAGEYLQALRVQAACHLLRNSGQPLAELALEHGFADQSHFNRTFRKIVGISPGAFRAQCRTSLCLSPRTQR